MFIVDKQHMDSGWVRCPVCDGERADEVYDMRSITRPGQVPGVILACSNCEMWYKAIDGLSSLSDVYDDTYAADNIAAPYMAGAEARKFSREILAGIDREHLPPKPTLLDIGSGLGILMDEAQRSGFQALGVDICRGLVKESRERGLNVIEGAIEDFEYHDTFDVITLMDLIEHVEKPKRLLAKVRQLLRPDGELVIYTPNHDSSIVKLGNYLARRGAFELAQEIFASNHVSFFSQKTLARVLHECGFELRRLQLLPYNPRRPGGHYPSAKLWALYFFESVARPFGELFRIVAYAKPIRRT